MSHKIWLWERRGDLALVIAEHTSVQALKKMFPRKRLHAPRYKLEWRDSDENLVHTLKDFDSSMHNAW